MKLNNKNIVFIGMPSAGKSYWGRKLSKKSNKKSKRKTNKSRRRRK